MSTLWWVEDEEGLREIFSEAIREFNVNFKMVAHFDDCHPVKGDLVIHDLFGVGKINKVEGVEYLVCSGNLAEDQGIDFHKPFDMKEIENYIKENYPQLIDDTFSNKYEKIVEELK